MKALSKKELDARTQIVRCALQRDPTLSKYHFKQNYGYSTKFLDGLGLVFGSGKKSDWRKMNKDY